ncbi:ABC transporter permease [Cohnella rhizosphaerae]|uniref:ABC transporter permease subunit n=1 Tax=Cohnella rhizosphaerae TaxID=1457232 RepID=A0A9X4QST8_9BACL|nr:ABC transporter permease subunit [Cohnella rhizosphaerae]MDG0809920.1 ABC transporter permease subunit [Cohnella rhizosphaerae]
MVLPFVAMIFAFNYIPLFGWIYAFFDYRPGIPLSESSFEGLKYFRLVFEDKEQLINVLVNTLVLGFLSILASPLSVIFAILLNETASGKFRKAVQTLTTLPNFISFIIVYSLATALFSSGGLLNELLMKLHWIQEPTNVMANPEAAWLFQTAVSVWKGLGFGSIVYLAAIAGIDTELFDAAKVDGAGRLQRIVHITVPEIMPTFFVLTLLAVAGILSNNFEQYFVFYNSLVSGKVETLDYYVYRMGIATGDIPFGTAVGMAKSIVSIALLFSLNALSRKIRGQSVFQERGANGEKGFFPDVRYF